jgi:hypothetical protein
MGWSFGLNPFAKISTYEIRYSELVDPKKLGAIAQTIRDLRSGDNQIDVVNISWGYTIATGDSLRLGSGTADPIEAEIEGLKDSVLFVAAAGNDGADKTHICDLRPACFDMPNVISVAGLNSSIDNPALLSLDGKPVTNYGSHVHIGAPGENVFSTISRGRYALMSGSSQAAPQVAGVASLLMTKFPKQAPQEIKNRLIYSSDYVSAFDKQLFGGRLNAAWALAGEDGQVQTKIMPGAKPLLGRFQSALLHFTEGFSGREIALPIPSIRGLHFDGQHGTYTVFYNAAGAERDSPLLRESNLLPAMPEDSLNFVPKNGPLVTMRLSEIHKYVSAIKPGP